MKHCQWICVSLLGGLLLTGAATRAGADAWNKKTYVTTSRPIEVPGAVLPAGKYVFRLQDSASNRHIVQIMNAQENHVYATNLAIPAERLEPAEKTILTFYEMPGGGPEPVRAWFYPGETIGQEFAYPKERATQIAQAVREHVPVLTERQSAALVNPAPVPESTSAATGGAATTTEQQVPPVDAAPSQPAQEIAQLESPGSQQPPRQIATQQPPSSTDTDTPPAPGQLPHTAGYTSAIGLLALCFLGIASSFRFAMRRAGSK